MVWRIILLIAEVVFFLWSLKSDLWLGLLQNVPYIGTVADIIENYLGVTGLVPSFAAYPSFMEEFIKAVIFTGVYSLLNPLIKSICSIHIGKHSYHLAFKQAVDRTVVAVISSVLCAMVTSLFMEYIYNQLLSLAASYAAWLQWLVSILSLSAILVVAFFVFGQTVLMFFFWVLTKHIIPTALKILSVEIFVVLMFCLLNIPGIMDDMMTLTIMCGGILCCIGAVFGTAVYDDRIDDYWRSGKHAR